MQITEDEYIQEELSSALFKAYYNGSQCALNLQKGPASIFYVHVKYSNTTEQYTGHIIGFGVEEGYRNKGFGTAILKDVIIWADKNNVVLTLDACPSETSSMSLLGLMLYYEKNGFKPIHLESEQTYISMVRLPNVVYQHA